MARPCVESVNSLTCRERESREDEWAGDEAGDLTEIEILTSFATIGLLNGGGIVRGCFVLGDSDVTGVNVGSRDNDVWAAALIVRKRHIFRVWAGHNPEETKTTMDGVHNVLMAKIANRRIAMGTGQKVVSEIMKGVQIDLSDRTDVTERGERLTAKVAQKGKLLIGKSDSRSRRPATEEMKSARMERLFP